MKPFYDAPFRRIEGPGTMTIQKVQEVKIENVVWKRCRECCGGKETNPVVGKLVWCPDCTRFYKNGKYVKEEIIP